MHFISKNPPFTPISHPENHPKCKQAHSEPAFWPANGTGRKPAKCTDIASRCYPCHPPKKPPRKSNTAQAVLCLRARASARTIQGKITKKASLSPRAEAQGNTAAKRTLTFWITTRNSSAMCDFVLGSEKKIVPLHIYKTALYNENSNL